MSSFFHQPVLLKEALDALNIKSGGKYIDATVGGGGHSFEILKLGGKILGIDCDEEAIEYTSGRWKIESRKWNIGEENLILVHGNFKDLGEIARSNGFDKVSGILFDLGVSSHQLESQSRGFSFQREAALDMRMDKNLGVKALDLINGLTKEELDELFSKLAQEKFSWPISNSIIRTRKIKPIETTRELANLVTRVYGRLGVKKTKIHPATRVFQALRIAVNDELNNLKEALPKATELLDKKGRLVMISFHSLEEKIIKDFIEEEVKSGRAGLLGKQPIVPTLEEIEINPRARSAKMRILQYDN